MLECHPANPLRPLHWRWLYAQYLVAGEASLALEPDCQVLHAVEFLRHSRKGDADATARQPASGQATHEAVELYQAHSAFRRWEVEARLLAGQSDEEIARQCALSPEAVERYHELFFSVRHNLGARDWVMTFVIGSKVYYGLTEADRDVILKRFAYLYGPPVLETLLAYYRTPFTPSNDIGKLTAAERERLLLHFDVQLAILSLCQVDEVAQLRYEALNHVRRDLQEHLLKMSDVGKDGAFEAQRRMAQTMLAAVAFRCDVCQSVEQVEGKVLLPLTVGSPVPLQACA